MKWLQDESAQLRLPIEWEHAPKWNEENGGVSVFSIPGMWIYREELPSEDPNVRIFVIRREE